MNELILNNSIFENIKHIDDNGNEYWEARELMPLLEYSKWLTLDQRQKEKLLIIVYLGMLVI